MALRWRSCFATPLSFRENATLSIAVSQGINVGCWKTTPRSEPGLSTITPSTRACPEVEFSNPAMMLSKVDLPHRSEEHTSELQSHLNLVCRLLLEKKKNN